MTQRERGWWHRRRSSRQSDGDLVEATPGKGEPAPSESFEQQSEPSAEEGVYGADDALKAIVASYAGRQSAAEEPATDSPQAPSSSGSEEDLPVELVDAELLVAGRPGIVDVVAVVGDRVLHLPVGLRAPAEEARYLPDMEDPVLGLFEDADGMAVATDALSDAELSALLFRAVTGREADAALVRQLRSDKSSVTLVVEEQIAFSVFIELPVGPRLGIELLMALDRVGFNHIAAPLALWRRSGRELGIVQEFIPGASIGWSVALTSVRDLYGSGGPPELAGGDFGGEAQRLGVMTARMHLGLDEAFGREPCEVGLWADALERRLQELAPALLERPDVADVMSAVRALDVACHAIRTHGDFHLGRVYRNEQGWFVGDLDPGGRPSTLAASVSRELFRSPLADVADMFWAFSRVANSAAEERDPTGSEGLAELADAWERHNREAFLEGYLGGPGIGDLVPGGEEVFRALSSAFELEHRAMDVAQRPKLRRSRLEGRR